MPYTNETFVFSAKDELSGKLKNIKTAAEAAGAALKNVSENAEKPRSESELKALREELKAVDAAAEGAAKKVRSLNDNLKGKASFLANIAVAAKGTFAVVEKIGQTLAKPFQELARFDAVKTRLAPLVGGLDKSHKLAEKLRKEAAAGTLEFEQLAGVAGKLASVFSSTSEIEKWTSAFHNLAAGTGMDVNELVGNFVRSRASGRFEAGFMDMFAQKGVNLFPELEKQTGKTSAELRKLAAEGKLAWSEVETAILAVSTGTGKFANAAAEASNTTGGAVRKLVAEWNIFLAKLATPMAYVFTPLVKGAAKLVDLLGKAASTPIGFLGFAVLGVTTTVTACAAAWRGITSSIRAAIVAARAFGIASKAALVSTGIGIGLVLVGSLYEFLASKSDDAEASAQKLKDALDDLEASTDDLEQRFRGVVDSDSLNALKKQFDREEKAWQKRLDAFEKDSDEYCQLSEKFEAWKKAVAEKSLAAERELEARKLDERRRAEAEEIAQMRERSQKIRDEIKRYQNELKLQAGNETTKILFHLETTGVESIEELDRELEALKDASTLTEEQAKRARELLDARKGISAIEREGESVRAGLREKIALLQAELQGNEALLAVKEQIRRAELRDRITKALPGATPEQIEAQVQKYIDLEKAIERKRKTQQAEKALQEEAIELERKRLQLAGDDAELKAFNAKIDAHKKYNELLAKGVDEATALAVAQEHLALALPSPQPRNLQGNASVLPALPEPQGNASVLPALPELKPATGTLPLPDVQALTLGAKTAVDSALSVAAARTADNTGKILLELQKRKSVVSVSAVLN